MSLFRPDSSIPLQALFKRAALIYPSVVVIFSFAILLSIRLDERGRVESTEVHEKACIEIASGLIARGFPHVDSDLRVIASPPALWKYLDSGRPAQRDELAGGPANATRSGLTRAKYMFRRWI